MKFEWGPEDQTGRCALTATAGDYDGVPSIGALYLGTTVGQLEPQVELVAAALAFKPYIGGMIQTERAVSPFAAEAVENFFKPRSVRCPNVSYEDKEIPAVTGEFHVTTEGIGHSSPFNSLGTGRKITLGLVHNHAWQGAAGSIDHLVVPANATLLSRYPKTDSRYFYPVLAAALLLSTDFRIRVIRLLDVVAPADDPHLVAARTLLRAINRELIF